MAAITDEIGTEESISAYGKARSTVKGAPLSPEELDKTDAYWRACLHPVEGWLEGYILTGRHGDRIPRFRVKGASVREALVNQQIASKQHAYEFGVDRQEISDWKWPF